MHRFLKEEKQNKNFAKRIRFQSLQFASSMPEKLPPPKSWSQSNDRNYELQRHM
jgi:hypothetical protein